MTEKYSTRIDNPKIDYKGPHQAAYRLRKFLLTKERYISTIARLTGIRRRTLGAAVNKNPSLDIMAKLYKLYPDIDYHYIYTGEVRTKPSKHDTP